MPFADHEAANPLRPNCNADMAPAVCRAGYLQFSGDRSFTNSHVQSRAFFWCKSGHGRFVVNDVEHTLAPRDLYLLPWDRTIRYIPDRKDPMYTGHVHLIPYYRPGSPWVPNVPHRAGDIAYNSPDRRDAFWPDLQGVVKFKINANDNIALLLDYTIRRYLRSRGSDDEGVNNAYPGANQGLNFNIRGQGGRLARNFLSTDFRPEFYTIERIDNSSGPNAILFGVGSAGGVANVSTKRAKLNRDATTFEFRTDTYGSLRATIDTNKVLVAQKLGLRLNAIANRGKGYRDFSDSDLNGIHLALKYRPFARTEVNVEYERDRSSGLISDPRPVHERITTWIDAGSPVITVPANWDALTAAAGTTLLTSYAPSGVNNLSTADSPIYVGGNQPYMINVRNSLRSLGTNRLVQNDALVPYTINPSGPGGLKEINRSVVAVSIDQQFTKNLFANVSLSREGGDAATYQSFRGTGGGATALSADPNATINNASALVNLSGRTFSTNSAGQIINPHAGEWYMDGRWRRREQNSSRDAIQGSLAWQFDAGKWFGAHNIVTNASYSEYSTPSASYDEMWINAPFNNNPVAVANAVIRRSYASPDNAGNLTNVPWQDTRDLTWQHPTRGLLTSGWVINGPARNDYRDRSGLIAAQSFWFKRRLVTTAGFRWDEQDSYQFLPRLIRPPGYETSTGLNVIDDQSEISKTVLTGGTRSVGAVLHLNHWLSLYGNKSSAISPIAAWKFGPDGLKGPNQEGQGLDVGVKFAAFENKLSLDIGYYDTATVGSSSRYGLSVKADGTTPWAWDAIFETLNQPDTGPQILNTGNAAAVNAVIAKYPAIRPVWLSDADVGDRASTGYEARLVANPVRSLRLRATFSITETERENEMAFTQTAFFQLKNYIDELKSQNPGANIGNLTRVAGRTTMSIDDNIAAIDQYTAEQIAASNSGFASSKYRASFNGTYDLPGRLKGWTTGLGMRYASARVVAGYQIVDPAKPNLILDTIPVYGSSDINWTAMLRYATRHSFFGRNTRLSFQLNVENLMNVAGPEVRRYSLIRVAPGAPLPAIGEPSIIFIRAPRSWNLSAKVDF